MSIRLHGLFGDNMMLQADKPARIFGKAKPGQKVAVKIAGKSAECKADKKGNFECFVGPLSAGGPYTLVVGNKKIKNVLVGDIWVCSGQSNMEMKVNECLNPDNEIKNAKYPKMRIITVPRSMSGRAEEELPGKLSWHEVSPKTIPTFSASGYYFGRELHLKTGRPIGLINTSWGGTRIEPWISMEGFKKWEQYGEEIKKYAEKFKLLSKRKDMSKARAVAPASGEVGVHADPGNTGYNMGYAKTDLNESKLKSLDLPGYWTNKGIDHVGSIWFRKTVNIPKNWLGNDLYLALGSFVDFDTTYFNGEYLSFTGKETPNFWDVHRKYVIPAKLVRPGLNYVAVRVFAHKTNGGSGGNSRDMNISVINKLQYKDINISGKWKYIVEKKLPRLFDCPVSGPAAALDPTVPTWIHNSMIAPLVKYAIKGAIWYQGESNASEPGKYAQLMPLLIRDWREKWKVGKFPFYLVQLAGYKTGDPWPELREAQFKTLSAEQNTGMASATDIGEPYDIHPKNKQEVGRRLALNALSKDYGQKAEYSGPVAEKAKKNGKKITINFSHADGLKVVGYAGKLEGFETAAKKGAFLPANAKLSGKTVVVTSRFSSPVFVRYAWENYPEANLYNGAGLPAIPFNMKVG